MELVLNILSFPHDPRIGPQIMSTPIKCLAMLSKQILAAFQEKKTLLNISHRGTISCKQLFLFIISTFLLRH